MEKDAKNWLLPVVLGGVQALLTLNLERLSAISQSPFWGGVQRCEVSLLFPGILGAMAMGGNVHAWSLWVAALFNGAIYFGLIWALTRLVRRLVSRMAELTQKT
jgi:hypothetical protein